MKRIRCSHAFLSPIGTVCLETFTSSKAVQRVLDALLESLQKELKYLLIHSNFVLDQGAGAGAHAWLQFAREISRSPGSAWTA